MPLHPNIDYSAFIGSAPTPAPTPAPSPAPAPTSPPYSAPATGSSSGAYVMGGGTMAQFSQLGSYFPRIGGYADPIRQWASRSLMPGVPGAPRPSLPTSSGSDWWQLGGAVLGLGLGVYQQRRQARRTRRQSRSRLGYGYATRGGGFRSLRF